LQIGRSSRSSAIKRMDAGVYEEALCNAVGDLCGINTPRPSRAMQGQPNASRADAAAGILRSAQALVQLAPPAAAAALASVDSSSSAAVTSASAAAAAAAGGLAPSDPPGYRALPRSLQSKFDAAWNVGAPRARAFNSEMRIDVERECCGRVTDRLQALEMPIMQKLALVIKFVLRL
jgi:hypothetical protein